MAPQGSKDGSTAPKEKVLVWITCRPEGGGEDLFLLLKTNEERGSFWQPVTGSVEPGETVETAARREMQEETSLKPQGAIQAVSSPYEFTSRWGGVAREYPFLARVSPADQKNVRIDPHEHSAFQWSPAESAFELLKYESNARVLRDVLKHLKGN